MYTPNPYEYQVRMKRNIEQDEYCPLPSLLVRAGLPMASSSRLAVADAAGGGSLKMASGADGSHLAGAGVAGGGVFEDG